VGLKRTLASGVYATVDGIDDSAEPGVIGDTSPPTRGAAPLSDAGEALDERPVDRHPGTAKMTRKTARWTATTAPKMCRIFIGKKVF